MKWNRKFILPVEKEIIEGWTCSKYNCSKYTHLTKYHNETSLYYLCLLNKKVLEKRNKINVSSSVLPWWHKPRVGKSQSVGPNRPAAHVCKQRFAWAQSHRCGCHTTNGCFFATVKTFVVATETDGRQSWNYFPSGLL